MRWYVGQAQERTTSYLEFEIIGEEREICPEYMTVMFRIFQEAITNVIKHADASRTTIQLIFNPNEMQIIVKDDGLGFVSNRSTEKTTWGLLGMQERTTLLGGQFLVTSIPDQGTKIEAIIPYCSKHRKDKK